MSNSLRALIVVFLLLVVFIGGLFGWAFFGTHESTPTPTPQSSSTSSTSSGGGWLLGIGVLSLWLLGLSFYFFPSFIALGRQHHNAIAILFLNLLLGWTVLGWIAAFIWSLTAIREI